MSLKSRIQQRLEELGLSLREASIRSGMGETFVRDLLNSKTTSPKASSLKALAAALETTPEWLLEQRGAGVRPTIPVRYFVGAGAVVTPFDQQDVLEYVDAPPGGEDVLGAAIVKGNSQMPALNPGDMVFWGNGSSSPADHIGIECVVTIAGGVMMVKTVLPGSKPGCYTLTSHNAPAMVDVEVEQALPVLWVRRRLR